MAFILSCKNFIQVNVAYTLGYVLSFVANFYLTAYFTFGQPPSWKKAFGFGGDTSDKLSDTYRIVESLSAVGFFPSVGSHPSVSHCHSGKFFISEVCFQTKVIIFEDVFMIVKNDMKKVTLLIPVYNEEAMLPTLYQRLIELVNRNAVYEWEILFVNDGSSDTTLECLRRLRQQDKRVNYVNLSRNFGKEVAMLAGFDYATGDCCVVMDADLQDPPELVDQMLEYWEEGYDDIYAKRRTRGEESWLRRQFSLAFYGILQRMSRIDILPNVGDFRLLDRRCVLTLRRLRECERYTKGLFCWIGYQKKSIEFDRGDRLMGHSSWNFLKLLNLAVEGITSFSIAPLRIATVCGVLCSISSFIYAIYFLIKTVLYGDETAGFPTLIIVMLFLGGIQLFSLGIIGEYVGRIFKETKGRPTYIASDYNEEKLGYDR